jgi:hypothetical protein
MKGGKLEDKMAQLERVCEREGERERERGRTQNLHSS